MNQKRLTYKMLAVPLILSLMLSCNFLTGLGSTPDPDQDLIQELLSGSTQDADQAEQAMLNLLREQNGARAAFGDQADAIFLQIDQARAAAVQDLMDEAKGQSGDAPKVPSKVSLARMISMPRESPPYTKDYQADSRSNLLQMFLLSREFANVSRDQNGNATPQKIEGGDPVGAAGSRASLELKLMGSRLEATGTITSIITEPFPYEETLGFTLSLEVCPDAQGNVPVQLSFQSVGGLQSGGGRQLGVESQVTGHVNDEGVLDSYDDKSTYQGASQPKNAGQGGGEDWGTTHNYFEFQLDMTQYTDPGIPDTADGSYIRESSENDRRFTERAVLDLGFMKDLMIIFALNYAEKQWMEGYCLEVKVSDISAGGENVSPNSDTPFTAKVRHKFDSTDLTVPVIATLSAGQVSVTPFGSKVPAPANFIYKAPDKSGQKATIHLETRSKRGIAKLDLKFSTGGGWKATGQQEEMTYSGVICDLEQSFTVDATSAYYEFTIQFAPAGPEAGSFTFSGTWFEVGPMDGSGSYTVNVNDTVPAQLTLNTAGATHTQLGDIDWNVPMYIDLTPLDTNECGQP